MSRATTFALFSTLALAACTITTTQLAPAPQAQEFRGRYVVGLETSTFYPCTLSKSESEGWLVVIPDSARMARGVKPPKGHGPKTREYYVRWLGVAGPLGRYGPAGAQSRELTVVEMLEVRSPSRTDCPEYRAARD